MEISEIKAKGPSFNDLRKMAEVGKDSLTPPVVDNFTINGVFVDVSTTTETNNRWYKKNKNGRQQYCPYVCLSSIFVQRSGC